MKFVDTKRASPVIFASDLPWEYDMFHKKVDEIPTQKSQYTEFVKDNHIVVDSEWWVEQERRCREGIWIPNAIEKGGDAYPDEVWAFWSDTKTPRYLEKYDFMIPANACYVPQYDLLVKDKMLHITGRHYFYLNFWKIFRLIEGQKRKDVKHPKFLDIDYMFFQRMQMMYKFEKDASEAKSRQQGFSEKLANLLGWNYTFLRNSVNIVAGGMSDDAEHTIENAQRGLEGLINTQFYKERVKSKSDFWKAKHFGSELRAISCKDNAQAISRFTPTLIVYEEVGKWKRGLILQAKEFVDVSLQAEGTKTGYGVYIGTGGDMEEGAADLEEIHYNPDAMGTLSFENMFDREGNMTVRSGHFTSADLFTIIDEDGNSLRAKGKEKILTDRKTKKPKDRYTHTTQQALYASDAFMIKSGGYFGEEIAGWCNQRVSYINTHKEAQIVENGRLEWRDRRDMWKGVVWESDPHGDIRILEHPMLDNNGDAYRNLYGVATDSYDQDEAYTSTSMGACWVKKKFLNADSLYNLHVAGILQRPATSEGGKDIFYENTAKLTMYYGARNLIEWSKILIFEWYINNGLEGLLKERPEFIMARMIQRSQATNNYGIDPSSKPHWLKFMTDYLGVKENVDKCFFPELLKAWAKYKYMPGKQKYNCDITIATSLCEVMANDEKDYEVFSMTEKKDNPSSGLMKYKRVGNKLVQVW